MLKIIPLYGIIIINIPDTGIMIILFNIAEGCA
jgi:hypothetical protein